MTDTLLTAVDQENLMFAPQLALTAADDYVVELSPELTGPLRTVALASCVCLDVIRDLRKRNRGAGGAGAG